MIMLQFENYTISAEISGWSLTVKLPSESEKSKTGFTEKTTYHATLKQVADKIVRYELVSAKDAKSFDDLINAVNAASKNIESCIKEILEAD